MKRNYTHYSEEERLSILREYYLSGMTPYHFSHSYGLSSPTVLISWLRKYESHPDLLSLRPEAIDTDMANRDKESYKEENAALKKRIKELEKALAFSKLETEARDIMIEKAEAYFNIPIRKKSGAKQ